MAKEMQETLETFQNGNKKKKNSTKNVFETDEEMAIKLQKKLNNKCNSKKDEEMALKLQNKYLIGFINIMIIHNDLCRQNCLNKKLKINLMQISVLQQFEKY